jgi:hypothetical protein
MKQSEMLESARREYTEDQIQTEVLRVLEPGNEFLQDLVDSFCKTRSQSNKARVTCFYEMKASNVGAIVGGQERIVSQVDIYYIITNNLLEICGE